MSSIVEVLTDPDSSLFDSSWQDLQDPVDRATVAKLKRVVTLSKDLDRLRAKVKGLVTEIADFAGCSQDEVVEHLSGIADAGRSSAGFYNTFVWELQGLPTLKDPRSVLDDVISAKSKESLRTQISDAKKAVNAASTRRGLTRK